MSEQNHKDGLCQTSPIGRVAAEIESRGLDPAEAARQIGVSVGTLRKHLAGEHVRSDSALKYQDWLEGRSTRFRFAPSRPTDDFTVVEASAAAPLPAPSKPRLVVDIFSGCGGLSLGFDLLQGGAQFETILALDIDPTAIRVLNQNAQRVNPSRAAIGQHIDLTEFSNASEFLAFYLEHVALIRDDEKTRQALNELSGGAFERFRAAVAKSDFTFAAELRNIRSTSSWRQALRSLDRETLSQTSVLAFHDRLKLPRLGVGTPVLPRTVWSDFQDGEAPSVLQTEFISDAHQEWQGELNKLLANRGASGRGQLAVSPKRVAAFVHFVTSDAFAPVHAQWVLWRARRRQLVVELFSDELFCHELRELYERTYPVSVLVGGPPCQGFSRIGRGKIRSLRDARMHAHGDRSTGDTRNRLFVQYVAILEALRPQAFLFENVQHFQSTVQADGGDFQATEVLEEAIANVSAGEVSYSVSSAVLNAARHGLPQNRIRYFMCGMRNDASPDIIQAITTEVLALGRTREVPLSHALAGLPDPLFASDRGNGSVEMTKRVTLSGGQPTKGVPYESWVRQPIPGSDHSPARLDSHVSRGPRTDDAAFYSLLGPGQRWMDYRADHSETVVELQSILRTVSRLKSQTKNAEIGAAVEAASKLLDRIDGSLPLRLLLENISNRLGYEHHLLKESYLAKRDGQHGDWLARMDPRRPSKTMVSHMSKDTYAFVHPFSDRTISVREAARIQGFPDWFSFGEASLTEAFKMIGNAVPPFLSHELARRLAAGLARVHKPDLKIVAQNPTVAIGGH